MGNDVITYKKSIRTIIYSIKLTHSVCDYPLFSLHFKPTIVDNL